MRLSARVALRLAALPCGWVAAFVVTAFVAASCASQLTVGPQIALSTKVLCNGPAAPIRLSRVEQFPPLASDWQLLDWRKRTESFLDAALDPTSKGEYLPLLWWDDSKLRWPETTFGLPSYIGMKRQGGAHEAIVTMGALLSGGLIGRDMTRAKLPGATEPVNLVRMQQAYFSPEDGVFLNNTNGHTGGSFWYEIMPNLLAGALVAQNPGEEALAEKWHAAALRWADAAENLHRLNDFSFQAYDLRAKRAVVQEWREPDSAAGLAYLGLLAHAKFGEARFHHMTRWALDWLDRRPAAENPNYEFFTSFGVYAAARCNAEFGTHYDVAKMANWCFDNSFVRGRSPHLKPDDPGDCYGVIAGTWGGRRVAGIVGASNYQITEKTGRCGYGFVMETFAYAWPLSAAVRYDNRLARGVGKWLLHTVDAARLFYPDQVPPSQQTDWEWAKACTTAIPYEGLMERHPETGAPGPFAAGDARLRGWGPSNVSLYSGALVGVLGAVVQPTNVEHVLRIDTRATDFHARPSLPTFLYYNPHPRVVRVKIDVGVASAHLWDGVSNSWLARDVSGETEFGLAPDTAAVVTIVPAKAKTESANHRLTADGIVVDFDTGG
jgi:hypothetical protein